MTTLIVFICIALLLLIILQVARVRDLAKQLRGAEEITARNTNATGLYLLAFVGVFLTVATFSAFYYKNYMLGYGPHESASEHGLRIDTMMNWTLLVTYSVFILTHILLFYYAFKYRTKKGRKAQFISHDNTLEIAWTAIPAVVMTFLVIGGLDAWNDIMGDVGEGEDVVEIEATGYQFGWQMRYPGPDGLLGKKDFRLITGVNALGQDFRDPKNHDDILMQDVVLKKGQKYRVRITAQDVLHDFYLPQFRVKMDAVPGLPTYFVFTPTKTTKEYRKELSQYEEYQVIDEDDGEKMLWETRDFELACAELCGIGHWSMRKKVIVLEPEEYDDLMAEQESFYLTSIRNSDADPFKGELLPFEIKQRSEEFNAAATSALETPEDDDNTLVLEYVTFETGSATLTSLSRYQLDDAVAFLEANPDVMAQLRGHTDNQGDAELNMDLSERRARAVQSYLTENGVAPSRLTSVGFGQTRPLEDNATEEGRAVNRRTELYITNKTSDTDETVTES